MDRPGDEVLVETADVFNVELAERAGPLVASEVKLLACEAIFEQVGDEARVKVLETLIVQIV